MSNLDRFTTQPDWQEQYSAFALSTEKASNTGSSNLRKLSDGSYNSGDQSISRPLLEDQASMGSISKGTESETIVEGLEWYPEDDENSKALLVRDHLLPSTQTTTDALVPINSPPIIYLPDTQAVSNKGCGAEAEVEVEAEDKDEDIDIEDCRPDSEGADAASPKTAAERRAEHRKMKRFRLTHQQTRFLMSEFAKQAHPDAANRERLSREIPGLSPRQVQVWFQNRRAKIKRLTADDRERIVKMRAVPDEFDNVQALHSPYGAVHGIGASMQQSMSFVPTYSENLMRPMMMESIRSNSEVQMPITAQSASFDSVGVGFNPTSSFSTSDILSSASLKSPERYYRSHLSSPMSTRGPRSPGSFNRYQSHPQSTHPRRGVGPLQTSQRIDTMPRSKSDSVQSPLRLSMSWKEEAMDYAKYQNEHSPQLCEQLSIDQTGYLMGHGLNTHQYDPNSYSNKGNIGNSPTGIYPANSATLSEQVDLPSMSHIPQGSSAYTYGATFHNQYRGNSSLSIETSKAGSYGNTYTTGYLSTPTYMANQQKFLANNSSLSTVKTEQSAKSYEIQDSSVED
ncbi:hypothetical protein K3495_g3137 [Podosphaera aphanis]|nr:hypothetical protein K3495_g3137 [Podosphaera aphanis]